MTEMESKDKKQLSVTLADLGNNKQQLSSKPLEKMKEELRRQEFLLRK